MAFQLSKFYNEKNYKYILIAILLAAFLVRIAGINTILFFEEAQWGMFAEDRTFTNLGLTFNLKSGSIIWPHNPLVPILFKLATLQSTTTAALRIVPLIFGMATIGLMYFMTRRFYSNKTALITVGLMAVGYWHLLASLVVDIDGAVLTFFIMLMSYGLLLYDEERQTHEMRQSGNIKKYLILSGIAFGIALLAKFTAFLLLPIIFVYLLTQAKERKIIGALKATITILLLGLAVFSIFPISSVIIGQPEIFLNSISHSGGYTSFEPSARPFLVMFVFGTPLFILLSIASIINWKRSKNIFFLLLVFYFLFMYSFFLGSIGTESTYEKYLMVTIPAMSLLAGDFISRVSFSKKLLGLLTVIFFAAMFLMNIPAAEYIDHSVPEYQRRAIAGEWNYNFPLMGNVQPGFWINFYSLAIMSIISILFFVLYLIKKSKIIFMLFIAAALSINLFYAQEFLIHGTHPDINKPTYDMTDFYNTNYPDRPLYTNAITLAFYTHKTDDYFVGSTDDTKDQALAAKKAGAVMLVTEYYPNIHKDSQAWQNINTCRLEREFSDKEFVVGRAFVC